MNKQQQKYQKFETSFDRKAKRAEKLHLRQRQEQDALNMQVEDEEELDDLDAYENEIQE